MIKSMTGFGRFESNIRDIKLTVEIRTVNHKYHEIMFKMPKDFYIIEDLMRKKIKEYVQRGRVDVFVTIEKQGNSNQKLKVDWNLVNQYINIVEEFGTLTEIKGNIELRDLLKFPDIINLGYEQIDVELLKSDFLELIELACKSLVEMRMVEGNNLYLDLSSRIDYMKSLLDKVEQRAPTVITDYRERLLNRINEWVDGSIELDESRLFNEVAFFTDKANIDEEITRLRSHFDQFLIIIHQSEPVGRKLDFLIQEMNREINTIGSKANDLSLSKLVVEMKSELEKLREQVQNVE